jgi:hypothetical protein
MIRHGAGGHTEFFGTLGERFYLDCPVQEAVIGVQVQMCKSLVRHSCGKRTNSPIGQQAEGNKSGLIDGLHYIMFIRLTAGSLSCSRAFPGLVTHVNAQIFGVAEKKMLLKLSLKGLRAIPIQSYLVVSS